MAHREASNGDVDAKLAAIRSAARCSFPDAPDIDTMLAEINAGYARASEE